LHYAGSLPSGITSSSRWASFNSSAVVPRPRRHGFFFSAFFLRFRCRLSSCLHGIGFIEFLGRFVLLLFPDTRFQFFNEFVGGFELSVALLIDLRQRINQIEQLLTVELPFAQVFLDLMHVHTSYLCDNQPADFTHRQFYRLNSYRLKAASKYPKTLEKSRVNGAQNANARA
jgi:hypothetical protein